MQKIIPTGLSNYTQVANFIGAPWSKKDNTTLNQKFDIQPNALVPQNTYPSLKCFTIGIGGHSYVMGPNNIPLSQGVDHTAVDAGLYNHIPFVIRPVNDDLNVGQQSRYCLRKMIVGPDNQNYIAYYGKRLDTTGIVPIITKRTVVDGQTLIEEYVYTEDNLSPEPPEVPNTGSVTTSNEYIATTAIIPMPFTEEDVAELYNVAEILFGDRRMAIISEFGFCTGIDLDIAINTPAGTTNFKEVIACQIASIISSHHELIYNSKGFSFNLEVGAVQPMLATNAIPVVTVAMT
jgi:hypothetical protein